MSAQQKSLFQKPLFILMLVIGSLCLTQSFTWAQAPFPTRPVTIWVGYPAGGTTDIVARILAEGAEKTLGQKVLVVNKPGGNGTVAASLITKEKPDGYTLATFVDVPVTKAPHLMDLDYDPLRDFSFIIRVAGWKGVYLVAADSPFKKWEDVVDWAKKNPGQLTVGFPGIGSTHHLAMVKVAKKEGFIFKNVPFTGDAPLINALLGGHVMIGGMGTLAVQSHIEAKSIRALLVFEREGLPYALDTPTFEKMHYDFGVVPAFIIIVAPKGTPDPIRRILEKAFTDGMKTERFIKITKDQDLILTEPLIGKPLLDYITKSNLIYEQFVKEAGIYKMERKK